MANDLIGAIEKGLKKVADFLEITPVEEEHSALPQHHSFWEKPSGHSSQVLTNRPTTWEEKVDRGRQKREGSELAYLEDRFKPVRPLELSDWRSDK